VGKKYSLEALTGELLEGETKRSIKGAPLLLLTYIQPCACQPNWV
jgi:hypothetical protein